MPENGSPRARARNLSQPRRFSRREFLQRVGAGLGGATVATLALTPACRSPGAATSEVPPPTSTPDATSTAPPVSPAPGLSSAAAVSGTAPFLYEPQAGGFKVFNPPGCTSMVADDRLYTVEHIWVKPLQGSLVALGVSDKLQLLMVRVTELLLPKKGETITQGDSFGYAEGDKLSCDLIAPVSGKVYQVNNALWNHAGDNRGFYLITGDPYVTGWLIVVELSKPGEIEKLLSPQDYAALQAKV